jgi:DNA processing protein
MASTDTPSDDHRSWLRLSLTRGVSVRDQATLLRAFGSADRLFRAPSAHVAASVGEEIASRLCHGPPPMLVDTALKWLDAPGHHLVTWADPDYPKLLLEIASPPCVLYVRGRRDLLDRPAVAIVGSRNASPQGVRDAEAFGEALSSAGLAVVSGLALGIDAAAHRGALRAGGSSVAVIGTGADRTYPKGNKALDEALEAGGAIVSEFPLGTGPLQENFPRRNRLISGLARGVLVVEAAMGSGSLITARYAAEQGRDVFALPGSIHAPLSKGCHRLIREGAMLVESTAEILESLGFASPTPVERDANAVKDPVPDPMLQAMGHAPISIDELVERTGRTAAAIAARLSMLEMRGAVSALAGGLFQRMSARPGAGTHVIE